MIKDLAKKNRSYRRFYNDKKITMNQLTDIIETVRFAPCGGNNQLLRFMPVCNDADNEKLFKSLRWAGYLPEWDGPVKEEQPTAYIGVLTKAENANATNWDEGIAVQTMLLAAVEQGFGGCILANIDRAAIAEDFGIEEGLSIKLVVALGVPKEEVVIEDISYGTDIKYYRDEKQIHHVPKYELEELIYKK